MSKPGDMLLGRRTWQDLITVYVLSYVDKRWPGAAANTRKSMLEALGTVTAALVEDRPHRPDFADLYRVLVRYALPPRSRAEDRPLDAARILRWLEAASMPLMALEDEDVVERALSAVALRLDGKAAAATVVRRKRAVFYNVLDMAATGKHRRLARNPLDTMRWKPPELAEKVDRRVVANPRQARELLIALTYVGGRDRDRGRRLVAMFACLYYAAMRPAEAVNLHRSDCELPIPAGVGCTCAARHPRSASATPTAASCTTAKASSTEPRTRFARCRSRPSWSPSCAGTSASSASPRAAVPPAERQRRQLLDLYPGLAGSPRHRPGARASRVSAGRASV